MLDRIDEAWAVARPALQRASELGFPVWAVAAEIALVAGDYETQLTYLRKTSELLEATGVRATPSTCTANLACVLARLGRYEEAEPLAQRGCELGEPEDIATQAAWRRAQALVESARGRHAEAELLAREAVDFALRGDALFERGIAFSDLAEVLEAAGRRDDAVATWRQALDCYERKEILPLARRVRERLDAIQPTQA
jgi:tetratricopeptide (TPR) repeat protein